MYSIYSSSVGGIERVAITSFIKWEEFLGVRSFCGLVKFTLNNPNFVLERIFVLDFYSIALLHLTWIRTISRLVIQNCRWPTKLCANVESNHENGRFWVTSNWLSDFKGLPVYPNKSHSLLSTTFSICWKCGRKYSMRPSSLIPPSSDQPFSVIKTLGSLYFRLMNLKN